MRPRPPARTPDNGALQRQTLQAGRRRAAIRLQTTGRRSPRVILAPEDSARQRASGGLFLCPAAAPVPTGKSQPQVSNIEQLR